MDPNNLVITIGCHVTLDLIDREGKRDRLAVDIVNDESADFSQGFLGTSTPLAVGILGEKAGVVIPYLKDDIYAIEILSVVPSTVVPPQDAQAKRNAKMKQTLREVEHTNAVVFASSFSGKWGDYDPDSLPTDDQASEPNLDNQE
jgi:hypothetical protein